MIATNSETYSSYNFSGKHSIGYNRFDLFQSFCSASKALLS
jgi:hypothetical protein